MQSNNLTPSSWPPTASKRRQDRHLQRHQLHAGRPDQEGQDVVLRVGAASSPSTSRSRNTFKSRTAPRPASSPAPDALAGRGGTLCPQGVDDQHQYSGLGRLTWQMSPRNKLSGYYDRMLTRSAARRWRPATTRRRRRWCGTRRSTRPTCIKWTSTVSSRLLIEGGFSGNIERYNNLYQPGIEKPYGSPGVVRQRAARGQRRGAHLDRRRRCRTAVYPGSLQHAGVGVLRHRHPQHQGRVPGFVGSVQPEPRARTATCIRTT